VAALALLGAYVTLPWWAPTGLLRRHLARQLSDVSGAEVTIRELSIDWRSGVRIGGLQIASPPGFGPEPAVMVDSLRAEFSPINLARGRLAWMQIDRPRLHVATDADGNVNVASLAPLLDSGPAARRVSIRNGVVLLRLPEADRPLRLDVSNVEFTGGRVSRLGRVTMSAALTQHTAPAPMSLRLAAGENPRVAAAATLSFADIDLGQLPLVRALGLPLARLHGRCDGSLELQLNRQAVVDRFSLTLSVRNLDAQPVSGPRLPVIEQAGVRISAAYDPLATGGGRLTVQSASVRLPGLDLAGQAKLSVDALLGNWQGVESVELRGSVRPGALAAVLTGRAELPFGLCVEGPVSLSLNASRQGPAARLSASADASAAEICRGGVVLKPAGRGLTGSISGRFGRREWSFSAEHAEAHVGANRFTGRGVVRNVKQLAAGLSAEGEPLGWLKHLDWQGQWTVPELDSLSQIIPPLADALKNVRFEGAATGRWFVQNHAGTHVHASLAVPAEAELAVGPHFAKPAGAAMALRVSAEVDTRAASLKDMDMDVVLGSGRLSVDGGNLRVGEQRRLAGRFRAEGLEHFRAALPAAGRQPWRVAGAAGGSFSIRWDGEAAECAADLELRDLQAEWPSFARLEPGSLDSATLRAAFPTPDSGSVRTVLVSGMADLDATVQWGLPGARPLEANVAVAVQDAAALTAASPWLLERLGETRLAGRFELGAAASRDDQGVRISATLDGRGLTLRHGRRGKKAGERLDASAAVNLSPPGADAPRLAMASVQVHGQSQRAWLEARAQIGPPAADGRNGLWPGPVRSAEIRGTLDLQADGQLLALVPELAGIAKPGARARPEFHLTLRPDSLRLKAKGYIKGPIARGPVRLTSRDKAELRLDASADRGLTRMTVRELAVNMLTFEASATASGGAKLSRREGKALPTVKPTEARVRFDIADAAGLERVLPDLWKHGIGGAVSGSGSWSSERPDELAVAAFDAEELAFALRGREVRLSGKAELAGVAFDPNALDRQSADGFDPNALQSVGRFRTDGLHVRTGAADVWLIADVRNAPHAPAGHVRLLGQRLDTVALQQWLAPNLASGPQAPPPERFDLTDAEKTALREKARGQIALARRRLAKADLEISAQLDRARTYDNAVREIYDLRHVAAEAALRRGEVDVRYTVGLHGGSLSDRLRTDLHEQDPVVHRVKSIRGVLAGPSIQPQIEIFFPGNFVRGTFTRDEDIRIPLENFLANSEDPRFKLLPVGTGRTVTTDGLLVGRAAPRFVTKVFPGLNLTRYPYNKMTGFAEYEPNGLAVNDMIFDGQDYDIYIEGTTDIEDIGRYEIGLILTPQSAEWNHRFRQGRVPVLKWKARIEGGQLFDQEVSYPWPNETLFTIFLKNNLFYRLWVEAGRQ